MSFGAPKQKPGQQLPAALQPRRQPSGSASSRNTSKSPKLVNSKQSSSDFGSRNSSASFRHNNNNHSNQRNQSLTSQGSHHHFNRSTTSPPNTTNNNNNTSNNISSAIRYHSQNGGGDQHHLFMLRGERYSLISDVLGFADSLLEDDEFDHAQVDFEKEDDPASPLAAALARFGQVPNSSELSPETYDALAVMERMNHTRRLLESMQVERQECLQHVQRGKEIYKSVFGRSIQTVVDENLRNGSSISSSPRNNNNSSRRSPGENADDNDDVNKELEFSLRHLRGEPKLQSSAMSSKNNRRKNNSRSPVRDEDESEAASPLSSASSSSSPAKRSHLKKSVKSVIPPKYHGPELKLDNVFVRLARTPPKASWVEAAEAAAYTQRYRNQKEIEEQENLSAEKKRKSSTEMRKRNDTPKKIVGTAAMNRRDAVILKEQARIAGTKKELNSVSPNVKHSPSKSVVDENINSDDIDAIPQRFQDPNRKTQNGNNEFENTVEDISDIPEIIRTPLLPNAWNEAKNLFSVASASEHHDIKIGNDQFYSIEYPSPSKDNNNNNFTLQQHTGKSFSAANSTRNHHNKNSDGMMPQMYRSYHPTVNFGSNLEWTGSVRWN